MKIYEASERDDVVESIINTLEKETGSKVFTMRVLEDKGFEEGFEMIVVLENKSVLMGLITVEKVNGKLASRIRMNYL